MDLWLNSPLSGVGFPVVYVDKQGDLNSLSKCIRGSIWEQLDEQWYICTDYDD